MDHDVIGVGHSMCVDPEYVDGRVMEGGDFGCG